MPSSSYDLVVLGDELPGLVAATICASRGLRVLLVDSGDRSLEYRIGPFKLPTAPLPLVGLERPGVERVLDELHFQHMLKRKLTRLEPPLQLLGPDLRLDVRSDDTELSRELSREFGDGDSKAWSEADAVAEVLDGLVAGELTVPPSAFFERREVGKIASRADEAATEWRESMGGMLGALVAMPGVLTSSRAHDQLCPAAMARMLSHWRQGAARLPGDMLGLRELFLSKFHSHNGERRQGFPMELSVGWNKVTGVHLSDGEEVAAQHVICAMPVSEIPPLFGRKVPKRLRQIADQVEVAGYEYVLHLVVDEIAVPEGLGSVAMVRFDPDAPPEGANALAIYVDRADDQARVTVTVTARCPTTELSELDSAFANLRIAVRERLKEVMPFYSEHVILAHSPVEGTPPEGFDDDTFEVVPPRPFWRSAVDTGLSLAGATYDCGIKHLSLASAQVLPDLGFEGDLITGWCAAKLACSSSGKKRDYVRGEVVGG